MTAYPWHLPTWQQFIQLFRQQRLPHALLITGSKGLAKTELATEMSRFLLCLSPGKTEQPCGHCHSCQLFAAGAHPEHLLIEPEEGSQTIKIDQIRELQAKQALTPTISSWKTVVIHPAQRMTISASNSLLKLLEEPPAQTLLFLVGSQPAFLPITIRSRCQQIHLQAPDKVTCQQWLSVQGIHLDKDAFELLYPLAEGSPLTLQACADQDAAVRYQTVLAEFDSLLEKPVNPVTLAAHWLQHDLHQLMRMFQLQIQKRLIQQLQTEQETLSTRQLWAMADCILHTMKLISSQHNYNKTLLIEDFIISVMQHTQPPRRHQSTRL